MGSQSNVCNASAGDGVATNLEKHYLFTLEKFPTEAPLTQELKAKANTECHSPPPPPNHIQIYAVLHYIHSSNYQDSASAMQ